MASSTTQRAPYTLSVTIQDQSMRRVLREGGYRLCVGDAVHSHGKYRTKTATDIVHPRKQPLVGTEISLKATFDFDPDPVPHYWIGYISQDEPGKIQHKRKMEFGQVYSLGKDGVEVIHPRDKDWVPQKGFGFQNIYTVSPVVLQEDPLHPGCTPADHHALNLPQPLWVPGVGKIEPFAVERHLGVWFQSSSRGARFEEADQSLMYRVSWQDYGDAASRKLHLWYSKSGILTDEDPEPLKPQSKPILDDSDDSSEHENHGFQPQDDEVEYGDFQNKGFQPQGDEVEYGDPQNKGFQPQADDEVEYGDFQNEGFQPKADDEVEHGDFQNEGFQPVKASTTARAPAPETGSAPPAAPPAAPPVPAPVPASEPAPAAGGALGPKSQHQGPPRPHKKPEGVNGASGGHHGHPHHQRGSRMKVTMMNGFF